MTEEELIQRTRELTKRWDNIQIVGQGWSGDARRGFQFNPVRTRLEPGIPGPPTPTGACCIGTNCSITTEAICELAGGTYQGDGTVCVPNPCEESGCPCQPTHMSISWTITDTGDPGVGEPTFNLTFTSEVDIPDLISSECVFSYFDCRTFVEGDVTDCPTPIFADPTCCFELSLYYDFDLSLWVVSFDIIFNDHAIKCGGFEAWPHPFSCGVSIDGSLGTRTFSCPPATIDEALSNGGGGTCPNLSGHGTVSFS